MLAVMIGMKPRDGLEGMLIMQLIAAAPCPRLILRSWALHRGVPHASVPFRFLPGEDRLANAKRHFAFLVRGGD